MQTLRIATRGSRLALWQAQHIAARIRSLRPGCAVSLEVIKTRGDVILDAPLAKVGGKGLFVKEIEEALLMESADLAVHSMKDVPVELPAGLVLACMPEREEVGDSLLSLRYASLAALPHGAHVGTSSLRRQAQLLHIRPDLRVSSLRGNVDTRLRKLREEQFDAIVLAAAALTRLDLQAPHISRLGPPDFLPAVGQGALGIECRADRQDIIALLAPLEHRATRICVEAERAFLAGLNGGCQVPIAAHARMCGPEHFTLEALVADIDGAGVLRAQSKGIAGDAEQTGRDLAARLLEQGAARILQKLYAAAAHTS
ncbi:MAG: hydroxymethylbilane synthase [Deltaproteobacteria bacterium]|jgi:hydroxymethylbilane synthase|nr:hydroxymethylbilane synthase [Deltaproteobacteria bacterium]